MTFKVQLPVCDRSDEFDGTASCRAGSGTPATAARPPRARWRRRCPDGQLHLPTNDLEIDAAAADVGRSDQLHPPGPARLGNNWQVETQFTAVPRRLAEHRPGRVAGGRQLLPLHADPQPQHSAIYVESSKDAPGGRRRGHAHHGGSSRNILATNTGPVTIKMRYTRVRRRTRRGGVPDPGAGLRGDAGWSAFPTARGPGPQPDHGARRDAAGLADRPDRAGQLARGRDVPVQRHPGDREGRLLPGHPGQLPAGGRHDGADDTATRWRRRPRTARAATTRRRST